MRLRTAASALLLGSLFVGSAVSGPLAPSGPSADYQPAVPISALARPGAGLLDLSRLQVSTEFSMGSTFAGRGTEALQVTRLSYQFSAPLAMRVSVGNAFGPSAAVRGKGPFLEGLDLSYRPSSNFVIQFHYQDLRTPLQLSRTGYGYDYPSFWR
jgi:hypothetical protein